MVWTRLVLYFYFSFFMWMFDYCTLSWSFHSVVENHLIYSVKILSFFLGGGACGILVFVAYLLCDLFIYLYVPGDILMPELAAYEDRISTPDREKRRGLRRPRFLVYFQDNSSIPLGRWLDVGEVDKKSLPVQPIAVPKFKYVV